MKLYKGATEDELFMCEFSIQELEDMHISPDALTRDEHVRNYLINLMFQSALSNDLIDIKTMQQSHMFNIGVEINSASYSVNFHVLKPNIKQNLMELIFENLMRALDEESENIDDNDTDDTDEHPDQPEQNKSVTVVVEYNDICQIIDLCHILKHHTMLCDLSKSVLYMAENHKDTKFLHIESNEKSYEYLIALIYEHSTPIDLKAYLTEDDPYDLLKARHNEHYKCIDHVEKLADI